MILTRICPRCQAEVTLHVLPLGTMTDPAPAKARLFVVKRCPSCGKRVVFWVGWRLMVK